jgi:hypothetical protein
VRRRWGVGSEPEILALEDSGYKQRTWRDTTAVSVARSNNVLQPVAGKRQHAGSTYQATAWLGPPVKPAWLCRDLGKRPCPAGSPPRCGAGRAGGRSFAQRAALARHAAPGSRPECGPRLAVDRLLPRRQRAVKPPFNGKAVALSDRPSPFWRTSRETQRRSNISYAC